MYMQLCSGEYVTSSHTPDQITAQPSVSPASHTVPIHTDTFSQETLQFYLNNIHFGSIYIRLGVLLYCFGEGKHIILLKTPNAMHVQTVHISISEHVTIVDQFCVK